MKTLDFHRLEEVAAGELQRLYEKHLGKVLADIADPTSTPDGVRTLTVKLTIKPNEERSQFAYRADVSHTTAKSKPVGATGFLARTRDGVRATEVDPEQGMLAMGLDDEDTDDEQIENGAVERFRRRAQTAGGDQ